MRKHSRADEVPAPGGGIERRIGIIVENISGEESPREAFRIKEQLVANRFEAGKHVCTVQALLWDPVMAEHAEVLAHAGAHIQKARASAAVLSDCVNDGDVGVVGFCRFVRLGRMLEGGTFGQFF